MRARFPTSAACFLLAWAATLAARFANLPWGGEIAGLAILTFILLELPHQRRYVQILFLGMGAVGLAGVAASANPVATFLTGWSRGATYAAFYLALTMLREAAETSRLVHRCGQQLVAQPAGRRYAALTAGGHLFGIMLSYGAIDLLAAMVGGANKVGTENERAARARRMLMAVQRGFCVTNCWSPLNIMTAVVATAVPGAPMGLLMAFAFGMAILFMAIGWAEDRIAAPNAGGTPPDTTENWSIHLRIVALVAFVMIAAETLGAVAHVPLVASIALCVPTVAVVWMLVQVWPVVAARGPIPVLTRRGRRFVERIPSYRGEATVLATSGFMGATAAGIMPVDAVASALGHLPPIAIPMLVPALLIGTGQLGMNPIATVALLGAALPDPVRLGIQPAALAFGCMLGWGLSVGMTPMSASAIITARWAGVSPWTVGTRWNAVYTLTAVIVAAAGIYCLDRFFSGAFTFS